MTLLTESPSSQALLAEPNLFTDRPAQFNLAAAAHNYAQLTHRKRQLAQELKDLEQIREREEQRLAAAMDAVGIKNLTTAGGDQVYRNELVTAALVKDSNNETDTAVKALKAAGAGWLVKETVNASTLRAWVKEQEAASEGLPAELRPWLKVDRYPRVGVKRV